MNSNGCYHFISNPCYYLKPSYAEICNKLGPLLKQNWGGGVGWGLEVPLNKKIRHYDMLSWLQNTRNPISEDFKCKNFLG